jgi:hypothetical protein
MHAATRTFLAAAVLGLICSAGTWGADVTLLKKPADPYDSPGSLTVTAHIVGNGASFLVLEPAKAP